MKLRCKFEDEDFRIGEICDVIFTNNENGFYGKNTMYIVTNASGGGQHTIPYKNLKELLEDWEDA